MDSHCDDISIGLYRQDLAQGPTYRLHTYSQIDGSVDRLAFLSSAMENMAGMQVDSDGGLYFNCGHAHQQAVKRAFLDVCKLPTASAAPEPRQPHIDDKKSGTVMLLIKGMGGIKSQRLNLSKSRHDGALLLRVD